MQKNKAFLIHDRLSYSSMLDDFPNQRLVITVMTGIFGHRFASSVVFTAEDCKQISTEYYNLDNLRIGSPDGFQVSFPLGVKRHERVASHWHWRWPLAYPQGTTHPACSAL